MSPLFSFSIFYLLYSLLGFSKGPFSTGSKIFSHIGAAVSVFLVFCCVPMGVSAFENIPVTITERAGVHRLNDPVSYGIPFSVEDNVLNTDILAVLDNNGQPVDAQYTVLARYHGAPDDLTKPIRMVLVDFQAASLGPYQQLTYTLTDDGGAAPAGSDLVVENDTHLIIDTGILTAKINKTDFNLFDEVHLGARQVVSSNGSDGLIIQQKGVEYTSHNEPVEVAIEENGPLKAVIRIHGYFKDSDGNKLIPPLGDNGLSYTVRMKFYKNKSYAKVDFSFENENQGWSYTSTDPVHNIWVSSILLRTTLSGLSTNKTVSFSGYSDTFASNKYGMRQTEIGDPSVADYSWNYSITKQGAEVSSGTKYNSFVDLRDNDVGLMVASRWFWQNYPKGMEVDNNRVTFQVLPETETEHRILGGIWKTTEIIYYFHDSSESEFADELAFLKKRLVLKARDTYYPNTNFFSAMVPAALQTSFTFAAGEQLQKVFDAQAKSIQSKYDLVYSDGNTGETLISLRDSRNIKINDDEYGTWYGWLQFGDFVRGNGWGYSATHYGWPYISLKAFLRFDDYNAFDFAEEITSHAADISILHDPYATEAMDSQYHGGHRYENDSLLSYHDTHSQGTNGPRFSSHFWNRGILLQYLLTGDRRYYDAALETAEHFEKVYVNDFQCRPDAPDSTRCAKADALRAKGRAVHGLLSMYAVSGDSKHLENAWNIFKYGVLSHKKTYSYNGSLYTYYSDSANTDKFQYSALQSGITIEGVVEMHAIYEYLGNSARADELAAFISDNSRFVRDIIYTSWLSADCGEYGTGLYDGKYFPYGQKKLWDPGDEWDDNEVCSNCGNYGNYYAPYLADMFAFQYNQTKDIRWLNLARSVFKDFFFYPLSAGYYDIAGESRSINGFTNLANAWAKFGQRYKKGMYYLKTEWEGQQDCFPDCSGKSCGSDGCGGSCGTCAGGRECSSSGQCSMSVLYLLPFLHGAQ